MEIRIMTVRVGRAKRPTRREVGHAVAALQIAESASIHAERDGCFACLLRSAVMRYQAMPLLPKKYRDDEAWMHRHVEMPGARIHLRVAEEHHLLGGSDD